MNQTRAESRPGEVRIDQPPARDAQLRFIGRIRTPWTTREQCPKSSREAIERGDGAISTIEIDDLYVEGLKDLSNFSHVWALYWMGEAARDLVVQVPKLLGEPRGVFALRSPARPNPIAMAAAELIAIEGRTLTVLGVDCLDGTPLIDIKPYFASTDAIAHASAARRSVRQD
ncbi:tRNA (N6-threonylcarbamoyladenosine(37)-N6)-methyltransferase TrmO [Terrarubrum flagellatum]|uniref:tRNA (N6-threonylcarbamoyladenosine(37)-N6)-methyltransferase TrmO n=1 Tax=Terrirubrum flagellatum TaxID=2895980 RepID=UPI003144DAC9